MNQHLCQRTLRRNPTFSIRIFSQLGRSPLSGIRCPLALEPIDRAVLYSEAVDIGSGGQPGLERRRRDENGRENEASSEEARSLVADGVHGSPPSRWSSLARRCADDVYQTGPAYGGGGRGRGTRQMERPPTRRRRRSAARIFPHHLILRTPTNVSGPLQGRAQAAARRQAATRTRERSINVARPDGKTMRCCLHN